MLAAALCPKPTWADAGSPAYLTGARMPNGDFVIAGLSGKGSVVFRIPLPGRGHAAAAHPRRPEAVAFARRPGTFAVVVDCLSGRPRHQLEAPRGRHFYGHGVFAADGSLLFTTENDFAQSQGSVGIWDAGNEYARVGEMSSGGIGPHDLRLMPDGRTLVVANGGIETHPDSGRAKLNLPTMRPNLSYLEPFSGIVDQFELEAKFRRNSIRHLSIGQEGTVAFALQWQGDLSQRPPLLGVHHRGGQAKLLSAPPEEHVGMQGYAGSIAVSGNRRNIAITSPRGGVLQVFRAADGSFAGQLREHDVCGISPSEAGLVFTTGTGLVVGVEGISEVWRIRHNCQWDNHLIAVA